VVCSKKQNKTNNPYQLLWRESKIKMKINKAKWLHTHSLSYLSADREVLPVVSAFGGFYEDR